VVSSATTAELVPGVDLEALVASRDVTLEALDRARQAIHEARVVALRFGVAVPTLEIRYAGGTYRNLEDEHPRSREALLLEVDRCYWLSLLERTHVSTLMDSRTREAFEKRLRTSPLDYGYERGERLPELTAENVVATLRGLHGSRREFFERGVEEVFRSLSWDHKTNRPHALGQRFITGRAMSYGELRHDGPLFDLERVLALMDGQPPPTWQVGLHKLRASHSRLGGGGTPYGEWIEVPPPSVEGRSLLKIKLHKNGNAHVLIRDARHVDELNRIMARRHPGAIGGRHGD
jgi:hypothetical protein